MRSLTRAQVTDALARHSRLAFAELMAQPRLIEGADSFRAQTPGGTFRAKANAWGNWYGYIGTRRELMFWGDYIDQQFSAFDWVKLMGQASALTAAHRVGCAFCNGMSHACIDHTGTGRKMARL